jgi:hypothetical protein
MYPLFCSSQCAQYNAVGARKHFGLYLHHKMSVLWDSNNPKYCNKLHKHGAGKRIAQAMGTVPEERKMKRDSLLSSFRRGRKWKQPTIRGSKREPSCPKLHLGASRIPKGVPNYSATFCSKMPMLAVIRATYGVRRSPVGLNVTRHFTIARTQ